MSKQNSDRKRPDLQNWTDPKNDHKPRRKRTLKNPDVFFTLKVYSQLSGRTHRSLKFSVDFNAPFQANVDPLEPYYVNATDARNVALFQEILEHVGEVYRYISDPVNYQPKDEKYPLTKDPDRAQQQRDLATIMKLTEGRINSFFYEQGSANMVGVSAVALSGGNGDMRPPTIP
ncbi:MAG TPA: hypothetical protein VF473_07385 [Cyclobacteriaceae bacterium]